MGSDIIFDSLSASMDRSTIFDSPRLSWRARASGKAPLHTLEDCLQYSGEGRKCHLATCGHDAQDDATSNALVPAGKSV